MKILRAFRALLLLAALLAPALAAAQVPLPGIGAAPAAETGSAEAQPPAPDEAAEALLRVLKDDAARAALIERLEAAGVGSAPVDPAAAGAAPEADPDAAPDAAPAPLGERVAAATSDALRAIGARLSELAAAIGRAPAAFGALGLADLGVILDAFRDLILVILVTTAIHLALRRLARPLFRRIDAKAAGARIGRFTALLSGAVLLDAAIVLLAFAAGLVLAVAGVGETGVIAVREALYLNAFLVTGLVRVAIRAVFAPGAPRLRIVRMPDAGAGIASFWIGVVASIVGYGQLLVAPIVTTRLGRDAGDAVSTILALVALGIALWLVLRGRRPVAEWLAADPQGGEKGGLARFLAAIWHVPAVLWILALALIVVAKPDGLVWPALINSMNVLLAFVAGFLASGFLARAIARGVRAPEWARLRLPLLERRLNAFVPRALTVARWLIVAAVAAFALDAAGIADIGGWLAGERGRSLASGLVSAALVLVLTFVLWVALASWIDYRLNPDYGSVPTARERTLLALLKNGAAVAILVLAAMFALSEIGVNIAPLIASAGVFGLALGFGAQKLVQDVITGIFIQLENAMNQGDVVSLNGTTGVVEKLTIRSVSLRDVEGCFHIIPFSSVDMVSNFTRDFAYFVADMGVAYREDVAEAKQAMFDAFDELSADEEQKANLLEPLQWFGLQALADSAMVLRARIKCAPGSQWAVGRAYNEIVKRIFDERGIEIPFPHQTIYFGVDKKGEAPPLHIHSDAPAAAGEATPRGDGTGDGTVRAAPPGRYDVPDSDEGPAEEGEGSAPR